MNKIIVQTSVLSIMLSGMLLAAEAPAKDKVEVKVEVKKENAKVVKKEEKKIVKKEETKIPKKIETKKETETPKKIETKKEAEIEKITAEDVVVYTQKTPLETKLNNKISLIKNNLKEKIKKTSRTLRRLKIEEIDNIKSLKLKLVSDYEAYMAELKKQSNELKANRYMEKEYQELQQTIVELTTLHKENQDELKQKLQGMISGSIKTEKMTYLTSLLGNQKDALLKMDQDFNNIRTNHINHKNMLKDTFYVDLENLKRKYHNDNTKLQELFKININEIIKEVDSQKSELKLDYWEGK